MCVCVGGKEPFPTHLVNPNCNDNYCEVKREQAAELSVGFSLPNDASKLTASIKAHVAGIWVPWTLGDYSDVCGHLTQGQCPVNNGSEIKYGLRLSIPKIAPVGTKTTVQLSIADEKKRIVSCLRMNVHVTA